jgi:hypothetical protein
MDLENITNIVIICPHCKEPVLIEKLNCCIFRHGALKSNGKQIDPHASKDLCDFYTEKDLIMGCQMKTQKITMINLLLLYVIIFNHFYIIYLRRIYIYYNWPMI